MSTITRKDNNEFIRLGNRSSRMTDKELKEKYCCRCINSDCNFDCIAKQEAPLDMFFCDNGEMFEELEENE